ncbi:arylamine N-acetyltransferase [Aneurinibacillus migulanus]|uniref:arylamine N-acetyltransferase family protein n=1 Tax=Aneurinibacillus migulanus TaxID=47500 RepID=UPI002E1CB103|nr:arylamine N-acetyltransferase [Aneurinibacillus migulanus]MED4729931.1 arylamine N-acetyltransferase [Aneurinibacillus migulanus]
MNVQAYLNRIQFPLLAADIRPTLSCLAELQKQHLLHVPFGNLDVLSSVPIVLSPERLYEKIILRHREGFCYELNGLFCWLLRELGFSAHLVAATVHAGDDEWSVDGSHATILVHLEQPYLVDVGFGDSARVPLPLTGEEREDVSGMYRIIPHERPGMYDLQKRTEGEWIVKNRFSITPKELAEFHAVCEYTQTSPESHFTVRRIVTQAMTDGRVTLSGNEVTVTKKGEKTKFTLEEAEIPTFLRNSFGIECHEER